MSTRFPNAEAVEALKKIPILQHMLPKPEETEEAAHRRQVMVESAGFLFLSRFTKEESENPKVREKAQKQVELEEGSISLEAKSHETSHGLLVVNAEKSRRYALSLATLAAKPHKREFIVDKGAISVLVELSALHDRLVQVRCASAFASLSTEPSIRSRMLEEGALPMINMLAQNSNIREIKFDCCRAICNLCCVPGSEPKLVKEGMSVTIMNIALTCPETYDICLHALVNLSSVLEKYHRIEDVSEALLFFFNLGGLSLHQETLLLQGFCNLSSLRSNQLRLVEEGALKVVEKYYQSSHENLRRMACEMLKNFTTDSKSRLKLLEINIIDIILEMSREVDHDIQITVAKCFLFLAKDASFRKKIVFSDAFVLILQTSRKTSEGQSHAIGVEDEEKRSFDEEIGQVSAKTLRILCDDHDLAAKLIADGISHAIVGLMSSKHESIVIMQFCIEALCSLFTHKASLLCLLQQHAYVVDHIVTLANMTSDSLTIEWCAFALYQITAAKVTAYVTLEEKILPCLLLLCNNGTDLTRVFCAGAFAHCTLIEGFDCRNCIPMLISLLSNTSSSSSDGNNAQRMLPSDSTVHSNVTSEKQRNTTAVMTVAESADNTADTNSESMSNSKEAQRIITLTGIKRYAATSLFNMAKSEDACRIMLEQDVLLPLVKLTQATETKAISAGILSRLSSYRANYQYFATSNVLQVLLELSTVDDRLTQRRVVVALSNLSQQDDLRAKLLTANPIAYIISLASSEKADEYLRRGCISILVNLSYPRGNESDILTKGVISTLMITSMITTNQIESRVICVKAIINLMSDHALYAKMVDEGLIWCLSKLPFLTTATATTTTTTTTATTTTAVADGTQEEAKHEAKQVRQMQQEQMLLELCSKALCRLSITPSFARKMIASSMCVGTVLALLRSEVMSLKTIGARTLTNLLLETKNESELDESFRKRCVDNMSPMLLRSPSTSSASSKEEEEELNELSVVCLCMASQSEACRTTIVNRQMMVNTHTGINSGAAGSNSSASSKRTGGAASIAKDRAISLAYITMVTNIANNEEMRAKILDEHLLAKLRQILLMSQHYDEEGDDMLKIAVAKALYCISCDHSNIPKLVDQHVLGFIEDCFLKPSAPAHAHAGSAHVASGGGEQHEDEEYEDDHFHEHEEGSVSSGHHKQEATVNANKQQAQSPPVMSAPLLLHLVAALYNLTTNTSGTVQQTLVSSGIIRLFTSIWPQAIIDSNKDREEACKLIILAVCHLACGRTNSSQMVREGCTMILNFITTHLNSPATANHAFYFQEQLRVSAAFRNLLSVVSNQQQMVNEGCLQVLIALANASNRMSASKSIASLSSSATAALAAGNSSGSPRNKGAAGMSQCEGVKTIRLNCAAALKCMTFNSDLRPLLMSSEAIQIIMAEIKKESDLTMSDELLKELEAESWENGGRGKLKEGRAKGAMAIEPSPLYTKLLLKGGKPSSSGGSNANNMNAGTTVSSDVSLNISKKDVDLEKYSVQVQVDDDGDSVRSTTPGGTANRRNTITRMSAGSLPAVDMAAITAAVNNTTIPASTSNNDLATMGMDSVTSPKISSKKLKLQRMSTAARLAAAPADMIIPQEVSNMFEEDAHSLLSIKRLTTKEESDETITLVPQRYVKQECTVETDPKMLMDLTDDMSTSTADEYNLAYNQSNSQNNLLSPGVNSNNRDFSSRSFTVIEANNKSANNNMQDGNISPIGSASSQSPSPVNTGRNTGRHLQAMKDGGASPDDKPCKDAGKKTSARGASGGGNGKKSASRLSPLRRSTSAADKLKQQQSQQEPQVSASADDEQMMHLVAMIKKAKELQERDERIAAANSKQHGGRHHTAHRVGEEVQESRIGEVLDKWKEISRF